VQYGQPSSFLDGVRGSSPLSRLAGWFSTALSLMSLVNVKRLKARHRTEQDASRVAVGQEVKCS